MPLQNLLNHTLSRLTKCISISTSIKRMKLISKWGCDGSSGHSEYMQKPVNSSNDEIEDVQVCYSNLFLITFVPLRLIGYTNDSDTHDNNENPLPSSTRLCRPIKFLYIKETSILICQKVKKIRTEISNLEGFDVVINNADTNPVVNCTYRMYLTMLDGKAINSLTDTKSSQTCYSCK